MRSIHKTPLLVSGLFSLASLAGAQIQLTGPSTMPTGQRAEGPLFADFNGDGVLDLAVTTNGTGNLDLVEVFRGLGDGTFQAATTVFLANGSGPNGLCAADFNGDGNLDIAVSLKNTNQVQVLAGQGNLNFLAGAATGVGGDEPRQISAVDMDGDGDRDLVVSLNGTSEVAVLANQAGSMTLIGAFAAGDDVRDHATGDFDGDGDIDVATASHDDRTVRVLSNNGSGSLSMGATLSVHGATRPAGLAAGDLDGDGDLDLVAACGDGTNPALNMAGIFRNDGGVFAGPFNVVTGHVDADDVVLADFSGDGLLDMALSHLSDGAITLHEGLGGLVFAAPVMVQTNPFAGDMAAADLDGNGGVDLGAIGRQSAGVQIFLNAEGGLGSSYCTANANSTGFSARCTATGSAVAAANNFTLTCDRMPNGQFGFFLMGQTQGFVANPGGSLGNLCLGGSIGRLNQIILNSGAAGLVSTPVDLIQMPTPSTPVAVIGGQTWNFQCWYRDLVGGQSVSNFSDGYSVLFQ
ncbi:MAG: VCBS repeat-containing protein [Planctomycetota bacterium]